MPSILTDEEREWIEAAVRAGKVKKIPMGVRAEEDEVYYDKKTGHLRYKCKDAAKQRFATGGKSWKRGPTTDPKIAARRIKQRDLMQAGKTGPQIARELGTTLQTIYMDAKRLGLKFSGGRK